MYTTATFEICFYAIFSNFVPFISKLQTITQFHCVVTSKQKHPASKKSSRQIIMKFTEFIGNENILQRVLLAKTISPQPTP